MRMLLVGAGAVGESIVKILQNRDPKGAWLEYVVVSDYSEKRAAEVVGKLGGDKRFVSARLDATKKDEIKALIAEHKIDFVMDAAPPFACDFVFDAAFESGAKYSNMGTWSVPKKEPVFGIGIENAYDQVMASYNFDNHEKWKDAGNMAIICLGIDPGVVNVFAKYAATHLFDEIHEIHVKDGGNLSLPDADPEDIVFGFSVWTVLDEVMNPNVMYDEDLGGFIVDKPFSGLETFLMPEDVGENTLLKVEHEETVTMPRFLKQYGLKKCTFKIGLDPVLINALKVLDKMGLRSIEPVNVKGVTVVPRDVVEVCAPSPLDLGDNMVGAMCVGIVAKGIKDGKEKEYFLYQYFDHKASMEKWGSQAVVAQTGFGAALAIELIGKGIWNEPGVYSPEYFDPLPYLELMKESGFDYKIIER